MYDSRENEMKIQLTEQKTIAIRMYRKNDFSSIQLLNQEEDWNNLVQNEGTTRAAWDHSNVRYVLEDEERIIGYVRGLTDENVTLYICELLIAKDYRGIGLGRQLLDYVRQMYPKTRVDLLASSSSFTYYEKHHYRPFYGFRKTWEEG